MPTAMRPNEGVSEQYSSSTLAENNSELSRTLSTLQEKRNAIVRAAGLLLLMNIKMRAAMHPSNTLVA